MPTLIQATQTMPPVKIKFWISFFQVTLSPVLSSEKGLNVFEDDQLGQYFQGTDTNANKVNIVKNKRFKVNCNIFIHVLKDNSTKCLCQKFR